MSQNFQNAKIYKITNDYNNDIYVGSTCNTLTKRYSLHKCDATKQYNAHKPLYKLINEIGFERFRIQLIEEYPCEDRYQLRQKEGQYIRDIGTLNKNIAGRDANEYQKLDKIKEQKQIYRHENKEELNKKKKVFYQLNKEKLKEKKKTYIENNKDHWNEKQKQYYEDRKTRTFKCECGCIVQRMKQHLKSEKHKTNMEKLLI